MSNWRRQKPRNKNYNNHHHHQRGTTMTQSPKPPLANHKQSVPMWEKDFCYEIGCVPWSKVLEAKRFMHLYDRVVQWDDSAGEEAFNKAKSHYWAERNGVSCDLPLHDPDVYIDDVDWDAQVDAELILDLERGPEPRTEGEEEEHVVILDALFSSEQYSGQGWGDGEGIKEENVGTGKPENSWDDKNCDGWNQDSWGIKEKTKPENSWEDQHCDGRNQDSWGIKEKTKPENSWDDSWGIKEKTKPENSWDDQHCDRWNQDSWGVKEKTGSWDHKNNNNTFKTEWWGYKNSNNNNSFNYKKAGNWNYKDHQGRNRGAVPRGGDRVDRVEDCRWRNGRGRSRGGFQQHPNGWGWTETFRTRQSLC